MGRRGPKKTIFRAGPNYPLPYQVQNAPLELYRTHALQARPDLLAQGLRKFLPGGYHGAWLPLGMGQNQWKKGPDGSWRRWDSSAQSYLRAVATSPAPPVRGGSTVRVPRLQPPPRSDRFGSFDAVARDRMERGAWRFARKPYARGDYPPGVLPISRNVPRPQLLPVDMAGLDALEESAIGAARRRKAQCVREAIDAVRAADARYYHLMRGGRW